MADFDYPPSTIVKGRVRLTDPRGIDIEELIGVDVTIGPPLGTSINYHGKLIALRIIRSDVFDGIVPDDVDDQRPRIRRRFRN